MPNTLHITFLIPPLNYSGWACFLNPFIPRTFLQFNIWLKRFFISYLTLIQIYPFCWYNTCKKICKTRFILLISDMITRSKKFLKCRVKTVFILFHYSRQTNLLFSKFFWEEKFFSPKKELHAVITTGEWSQGGNTLGAPGGSSLPSEGRGYSAPPPLGDSGTTLYSTVPKVINFPR